MTSPVVFISGPSMMSMPGNFQWEDCFLHAEVGRHDFLGEAEFF